MTLKKILKILKLQLCETLRGLSVGNDATRWQIQCTARMSRENENKKKNWPRFFFFTKCINDGAFYSRKYFCCVVYVAWAMSEACNIFFLVFVCCWGK